MSLIPKALARFNARHPEITTSLQAHHSRDIHEMVASRIFDIGVCELAANDPDMGDDDYEITCAFLCRRDDPLAKLDVVTPRDLTERTVVTLYDRHPTTLALREDLTEQGTIWKSHVECNLFTVALQLVLHGGAVSWVDPFTLAMFDEPGLCVRPFEPTIRLRFAILGPPDDGSPHAAEMIDLIRQEIVAVRD